MWSGLSKKRLVFSTIAFSIGSGMSNPMTCRSRNMASSQRPILWAGHQRLRAASYLGLTDSSQYGR